MALSEDIRAIEDAQGSWEPIYDELRRAASNAGVVVAVMVPPGDAGQGVLWGVWEVDDSGRDGRFRMALRAALMRRLYIDWLP